MTRFLAGVVVGALGAWLTMAWVALHMVDRTPARAAIHRGTNEDGSPFWALSTPWGDC